jgi:predicted RND superfamily exporter protein
MAPGLARLELSTDGHALVPPSAPVVAIDRQARETFGLRDPLLVVIETDHPDGVFNAATLARVARLTEALAALPGVGPDHVVSLATEPSPRRDPATGRFRSLLAPRPWTSRELALVSADVEAIDPLLGTLLAFDRRATAILVGVPRPDEGAAPVDRRALYHLVAGAARAEADALDRLSVVGAPAAEALLGEEVLADLRVLVPLSLLVIGVVLFATGGRSALLVGLVKVGAVQVFTFGLIGWTGQPIYLTTAILPVLLTTVGLSDEIHLVTRLRRRRLDEDPRAALGKALGELARPIGLTSLTSAAGFASFLGSDIPPVRHFGLFAACGVLFCLAWALTASVALLAFAPPTPAATGAAATPGGSSTPAAGGSLEWLARRLAAVPVRWATAGALALLALIVLGVPRLEVQDGWIANFAPGSELRTATERIDRRFAGTHLLRAVVRFETPPGTEAPRAGPAQGPLLDGNVMLALERFERALAARPEVGAVLGLPSQLAATSFLYSGQMENERRIDPSPSALFLFTRRIALSRGEARRRELVDDRFESAALTLLLPRANYRSTASLIAAARELEERHLRPAHGQLELAGDVAVSQVMIPAIVRGQLWSLGLALGANILLIAGAYRSWRAGVAATAPAALAMAATFGLMGATGVPLGVASSVFAAVTLGIGVDYGIHFLERLRAAGGGRDAGASAAREAGPAIVADALAIALGFGLLTVSSVPPNRTLGFLVAAGLVLSALATLVGHGRLLTVLARPRPKRPAALALAVVSAGEAG